MLTVYRASAGAGKTHKLTGEYLLLLFKGQGTFRHILAVTFTNKATDEMKTRIIDELYNLSSGKKSDYIALLKDAYRLTEEQIRSNAAVILKEILHDYSSFNISTIDKFFQQTMRAFTREIGLQGGFGIEMDTNLVLTEVVDNMLQDLSRPENKDLLNWLISFAQTKVEEGATWNLEKDIISLSNELFKETYKEYSKEVANDIQDKSVLENYKEILISVIKTTENRAQSLATKAKEVLSNFWLTAEDIKGGSKSPLKYLDKLIDGSMESPSKTFCGLVDNLDAYFTKTTPDNKKVLIAEAFQSGLNNHVKEIVDLFGNLTHYNTAKEIVRFYYTLGILTDISNQISAYRTEKNVMLIADTTELLNKVIDGSTTPFIYEKIGTRIDNYMIDEFQDTSGMQWENFRPLIEESLSSEKENLIVGDVKQSIYRFRNSDWRLLDEEVNKDFDPSVLREETLEDNWRSCRNIVEFNNALFTVMPSVLQSVYNEELEGSSLSQEEKDKYFTKIISAYDKSYQNVPLPLQSKDGHVKVSFIEDTEEKTWKEEALDRIPETVERLQDCGYQLKDIAILVRKNSEGSEVAEKLLSYGAANKGNGYSYDIISDEALYVNNAMSIRFIISLLRYLSNPVDATAKSIALYSYQVLKAEFGSSIPAFSEEQDAAMNLLIRQSVYETVEGLFRLFCADFPKNEQVFVQAFMDMISEFSKKESADIGRFLRWWDESGNRKTIATPDGQNAIRILTVHKSKGLGFRAVIVPFGDWEIDHKTMGNRSVILWCKPTEAPFNRLHAVPVKYSSTLTNTIFATDYFKEKLYAYVDNINTLYVALTRAKDEMIIFAPRPKAPKKAGDAEKVNSISSALWSSLQTFVADTRDGKPLISLPQSMDKEEGSYELGTWYSALYKEENRSIEEIPMAEVASVSPDDRLQLRLHGKGFFFDNKQRKYGTLMHEVLSHIHVPADIERAVDHYRISGIINREESFSIKKHLIELLSREEIQPWYDGSSRVLNEVDILVGKGVSKRPDRVMINEDVVTVIDYKFGEHENKRYNRQVKDYLRIIKRMGYEKVKGFIWYVELDKIEEVSA